MFRCFLFGYFGLVIRPPSLHARARYVFSRRDAGRARCWSLPQDNASMLHLLSDVPGSTGTTGTGNDATCGIDDGTSAIGLQDMPPEILQKILRHVGVDYFQQFTSVCDMFSQALLTLEIEHNHGAQGMRALVARSRVRLRAARLHYGTCSCCRSSRIPSSIEDRLLQCPCGAVSYCCVACQRDDWRSHRHVCAYRRLRKSLHSRGHAFEALPHTMRELIALDLQSGMQNLHNVDLGDLDVD